ncbi:MFS transporter [Pilimelia terevasa]|uniref:MFS transporter n=1 Tax=Pilimelia terevasa TaxID=53372 RepID=A0A8J3BMW1_9ACTN|nr:MFS transporter [Pilimelia terevasa]GGK33940.1 MFS transporter [Pilimelia terevasa]
MGNKPPGNASTVSSPRNRSATAALTVACIALLTDAVVYGIAVPVLPRLAVDQGAGTLGVGVLFAVYAGMLVAVTPLAGWWIDRRGNREPMIVGLVGLAAATLLFALATGPVMLYLGRGLQGAAAGLSWTAALALIAATHPPEKRGTAMGAALSAFGVGTLLGPVLGGLLSEWFDPRVPFFVAFALALADGAARWWLIPAHQPRGERPAASGVRGWPGAGLVILLTVTGAGLLAFLEPVLPLHLFDTVQAGPGAIGLVFGAAALIAACVPPLVGMVLRRVRAGLVATAGCLVAVAGFVGIGLSEGVFWAGFWLTVVAVGSAGVLTPTLTLMADIAESRRPPAYGAVYAMYTIAYTAGLTVAPLAAGALAGHWDFAVAARGAAVAAGVAAVVIVVAGRRTPRATGAPAGPSPRAAEPSP